jgi:hypothetical protein
MSRAASDACTLSAAGRGDALRRIVIARPAFRGGQRRTILFSPWDWQPKPAVIHASNTINSPIYA